MNSLGFSLAVLVAIALLGYLLGSFPTGYLAGRWLKGIDIREVGSGSTGATNVLRTLGKPAGATVLIIDALKGAIAVGVARWLGDQDWANLSEIESIADWWVVAAALAAVIGHSRPVWLGWRGGKSVATSLGVLLAMAWPVGLGAFGVFGLCLALWRIVSVGSMVAALAVPVLMGVTGQPIAYGVFGLATAAYVIWRHRANLDRLWQGKEPQIGQTLP